MKTLAAIVAVKVLTLTALAVLIVGVAEVVNFAVIARGEK